MNTNHLRRCAGFCATAALAVLMAACGGGGGSDDPPPVTPPPVTPTQPPVAVPTGRSPVVLTANTPPATFAALEPRVTVGRVVIDPAAGTTKVDFAIADKDNNGISGYGTTTRAAGATASSMPNLAFSLAKLVPGSNGSPSKWVSYIVTTVPTATAASTATRPTTDNTGTLVDNGNGTYNYTFARDITRIKTQVDAMTFTGNNRREDLGDLTYEPNAVHRLSIQLSGNAPGTGTNTPNAVQTVPGVPMRHPFDAIYDFIPSAGRAVTASDPSRDISATSKCNDCHNELGGIPGGNPESSAAGFHGGSRNEVRYCVVCHTEQRKFGRPEATENAATNTFTSTTYRLDDRAIGNMTNFVHKAHMGEMLAKDNYDYGGVQFNHVRYPQDIRNCTKCHDGSTTSTQRTAQGNNWMNSPSRLACGSCHDGIDFATGRGVTLTDHKRGLEVSPGGHAGVNLAQADDALCSTCHTAGAVDVYHLPVTPPNPASSLHVNGGNANTNAAWIASNTSRLPAGAIKVTHEIKSVSRNAQKQPVIVFRMLQNGNRVDFRTADASRGVTEMWENFMGAPSAYFVFSVPQDGIAQPSEFNASASAYLRSIWNGTATGTGRGTLSAPDADGFYTVTLTGVTIPDNAVMLTGGIGYSYNTSSALPLTQTNVAGYPTSPATATTLVAGMPNRVGGLIVITPNVQRVATGYTGRRAIVSDAKCNDCHQELGTFTEDAFHGGQRNDGTTCAWCHTPNRASSGWPAQAAFMTHAIHAGAKRTVPFNWHASAPGVSFEDVKYPGVLADCETCHLPGTYDYSNAASAAAAPNRPPTLAASGILASTGTTFSYAPYITTDVNYGANFAFNAATGVTTPGAGTNLVISPFSTACVACHDTPLALSHIEANGGSFYKPRSQERATIEQCSLCHGPGRVADIKSMHSR